MFCIFGIGFTSDVLPDNLPHLSRLRTNTFNYFLVIHVSEATLCNISPKNSARVTSAVTSGVLFPFFIYTENTDVCFVSASN